MFIQFSLELNKNLGKKLFNDCDDTTYKSDLKKNTILHSHAESFAFKI
jgi:hypothetical protein